MSYTVAQATELADRLIDQHLNPEAGGRRWHLVWNERKNAAGICQYRNQTIGLSRVIIPRMTEEAVRDTILHEIAHALTGIRHGSLRYGPRDRSGRRQRLVHDDVWRGILVSIGGNGSRTWNQEDDLEDGEEIPAPITGTCPNGHTTTRHRQPKRVVSCGECSRTFQPRYAYRWTWTDSGVEILIDGQTAEYYRTNGVTVTRAQRPSPAPAQVMANAAQRGLIFVGDIVQVNDPSGRFSGEGTVVNVGRTRYHVSGLPGAAGIITVPFQMATKIGSTRVGGAEAARPAAPAPTKLFRVGDKVLLEGPGVGKYAGVGTVAKVNRTKYSVVGLPNSGGLPVSVPFQMAKAV